MAEIELQAGATCQQVQAPRVQTSLTAILQPSLEITSGDSEHPAAPRPHDKIGKDPSGVILEAVLLGEFKRAL